MDKIPIREVLKIEDETLAALIGVLIKKKIISAQDVLEEMRRLQTAGQQTSPNPPETILPKTDRADLVKDADDFDLSEIEKNFNQALSDWDKKKDNIVKTIIDDARSKHSPDKK